MPSLAQFVALMGNEVRRGKLLVDLDTAQQSTRFLRDDFLRLLPLTRVDIDSIHLSFKMAVNQISPASVDDSAFLAALNDGVSQLAEGIRTELKDIPAQQFRSALIDSAVHVLIPALGNLGTDRVELQKKTLSHQFGQYLTPKLQQVAPNATDALRAKIVQIARQGFERSFDQYLQQFGSDIAAQLMTEFGRLDVVLEGEKLRSFPPDALVQVDLNLAPRTFHWSLKAECANKPDLPPEKKYLLVPG